MKYIITILIVSFFTNCKSDLINKKSDLESTGLTGTWRFQSSTDNHSRDHWIIILEDSSYYKFSNRNGGGLIEKGHLSNQDSLIDEREFKYGLKKIYRLE